MRAGRLREIVTFQRRSTAQDGFGEQSKDYTDLATVWGAVEPLSGREFFAAQQVQSDVSVRVTCRYSSAIAGVTEKDRIQHGAVFYDIRSVIDVDSRHRELQFMCTKHSIRQVTP